MLNKNNVFNSGLAPSSSMVVLRNRRAEVLPFNYQQKDYDRIQGLYSGRNWNVAEIHVDKTQTNTQ